MNKTFRANHSIIIGIPLWIGIATQFFNNGLPGMLRLEPVQLIVQPLLILFAGTIWFGIRYKIVGDLLQIELGPITVNTINIRSITSISRSYNPLSSPAPSLKRLSVRFGNGGYALISPHEEQQFLSTLREINPAIESTIKPESTNVLVRILHWLL